MSEQRQKQNLVTSLSGFAALIAIVAFVVWAVGSIFAYLREIPKEIAAPLITAAATIFVATLTVMVGRYFERKKELDALYRDKKTEIYDEFLSKFFELFFGSDAPADPEKAAMDLVPFLREFTRKLVLWSGPEVIDAFVKWKDHLAKGNPDAQSLFLTEQFLIAIRKDLRHPGGGLQRGFFAKLFLKNGDIFLVMAAKNPNVTLQELAYVEGLLAAASSDSNLDEPHNPK